MQKLVTRNIKDETLEHVPYIYNNLSINQVSPQKLQCTMWLHIYRKQWKTGSYTWTFLYDVRASDSISHDITKTPNGIGLETHSSDGSAPCWVAEKLQLHSQEKQCRRSVANCCLQRAILIPLLCCLVVDEVTEAVIHWVLHYPHQQKIHKYCLTDSSGDFEYRTTVVR